MDHKANQPVRHSHAWFGTTRWSVVLAAGDQAGRERDEALQSLFRIYWYPLYAYARHQGQGVQDAEDLIQAFLTHLLEKGVLARVTEGPGKFRSFLLKSLKHFMTDQWKRNQAQKRGGGQAVLPLDFDDAESRYGSEPVDTTTPETLFEKNWAVTLLNTVFDTLQEEQLAQGNGEQFEKLKFCLAGQRSDIPYPELARQLQCSTASIKVKVHRLRQRYREILRLEVANTVSSPEEIEEELQYLFEILSH